MSVDTLNPFDRGFLLGLLVGEGHFGGDGRQAHVVLRMHVRHEKLFRWLERSVPEGRLYGPYSHGGRNYYQWMVRGRGLREGLWPFLARNLDYVDEHIRLRMIRMAFRYSLPFDKAVPVDPAETAKAERSDELGEREGLGPDELP